MLGRLITRFMLVLTSLCLSMTAGAASLTDIQVSNGGTQAKITFSFVGDPVYAFNQQSARVVALDIQQTGVIQGLPLRFSGENLVHTIRAGQAPKSGTLRLLVDLTKAGSTAAIKRQDGANYQLVFTITATAPAVVRRVESTPINTQTNRPAAAERNPFSRDRSPTVGVIAGNRTSQKVARVPQSAGGPVVIAIDAGHGGQDPGAIGAGGTREKNVTLAVARKLRELLNADPQFKGVLTRTGDYFISVMGRSDVARRQNANLLVSIHADAAPNRDATGASVWVLSNRRAESEMASWLEQHEKQSELLGGAGDVLANSQADPYLSQAVLDLQFGHSQRVGYDVATHIIRELRQIGSIHKSRPQHASLGVLRSPDIPSLLVETGFISNRGEESLLASDNYQQRLAVAIYQGLRDYYAANPLQSAPKG